MWPKISSGPFSSPLSSLASTGIMPYVLTFRDVEYTQALTFALVQKREGSLSRGEGLLSIEKHPYSWFSVIAKRRYRAPVENTEVRSRVRSELLCPSSKSPGFQISRIASCPQVSRIFRISPPSGELPATTKSRVSVVQINRRTDLLRGAPVEGKKAFSLVKRRTYAVPPMWMLMLRDGATGGNGERSDCGGSTKREAYVLSPPVGRWLMTRLMIFY